MDLSALQAKILQSSLLADAEKKYWMASLVVMTVKQLQVLDGILQQATTITAHTGAAEYLPLLSKAASFLS